MLVIRVTGIDTVGMRLAGKPWGTLEQNGLRGRVGNCSFIWHLRTASVSEGEQPGQEIEL